MTAAKRVPAIVWALAVGGAAGVTVGLAGSYLRRARVEAELDVHARLHVGLNDDDDNTPAPGPPGARLRPPPRTRLCFAQPGGAVQAPGRALLSGALVASVEQGRVAAVDSDNRLVHLVQVGPAVAGAVAGQPGSAGTLVPMAQLHVGQNPAHALWTADERVLVTERGDNRVSAYDARTGQRLCSVDVAVDPYAMALSADGARVYVTSGLSHTLTALDAATLAPLFTVELAREPRGIALDAAGQSAFVAHVAGAPLSRVDLLSHAVRTVPQWPQPATANSGVGMAVGVGRIGAFGAVPELAATPLASQAWSVAVDDEHHRVLVPFMLNRTGAEVPAAARVDRYGGGSVDPETGSKVQFAVGIYDLQADQWVRTEAPRPRVAAPSSALPATTAELAAGRRGMRVNTDEAAFGGLGTVLVGSASGPSVRLPVAAALTPSGALRVASLGTASVVSFLASDRAAAPVVQSFMPMHGNRNGAGAAAVTVESPDWAGRVPGVAVRSSLVSPAGLVALRDGRELVWSPWEHLLELQGTALSARMQVSLGPTSQPAALALGRRLFHTANDARLSSGGLSCGGCHPDGRDDGLVWFLSQGPRQTPTLAGRVVAPYNWNGTHPTVEGNVAQTVTRLGGTGLTQAEVDALALYVQQGLFVPAPASSSLTMEQERGRTLFTTTAACSTCHDAGRNFTDGQRHELGGLGADETDRLFDTPSLRFVGSTAPYFHDGRYATLRAMLRDASHHMGHVELLSSGDVDALEAYLRTL